MNIIFWILFGGLVGWIASMLVAIDDEPRMASNIITGVLGATASGCFVGLMGGGGIVGFSVYSILVAVGGALLTLFCWQHITSR